MQGVKGVMSLGVLFNAVLEATPKKCEVTLTPVHTADYQRFLRIRLWPGQPLGCYLQLHALLHALLLIPQLILQSGQVILCNLTKNSGE